MSDFIFRALYDPNAVGAVDFHNTLSAPLPRAVPQGCYLSWIDPQDSDWCQQKLDGNFTTAPADAKPEPAG